MLDLVRRPVDDPVATALLAEYFEDRTMTFVSEGGYRIALPDPARFTPPAGVFLLALDEDGVAQGCGGLRRIEDGPLGPRFEVKHLFLREALRGRGAGRAMLGALENAAVGFGAAEVVLDTNDSLEAAGHLYRAMGYEVVEPYNDNPNATTWYAKRAGSVAG